MVGEILYKRNTPLMAVEVNALVRWLKRPCNWIYFDVNKLHPKLRAIIKRCQEQWGDRWLTTGEAGALVGVGHKAINQRINRGSITNVARHGNWYVRRSEILATYGVNQ